jgi:hypothetical protein
MFVAEAKSRPYLHISSSRRVLAEQGSDVFVRQAE